MSRLQQSWINTECFYSGKYSVWEFSVLWDVGHGPSCPVPGTGMDSASAKTIGGQEIGGNRRDTIPKGAFPLPIVLEQVNNRECWLSCY